jgi:hypothetical protein
MKQEPKEFGATTKGNGEGLTAILRSAIAYLEGEQKTQFRMKLQIIECAQRNDGDRQ